MPCDGAAVAAIDDLTALIAEGAPIMRRELAPASGQWLRLPLIPGTETFSNEWLPDYHARHSAWIEHDVACYSLIGARISGEGYIWLGDRLVTAPEIMPVYVAEQLATPGGWEAFHATTHLPVRSINRPCLVAVGHGTKVYGHFVMEMLFRILVARRAFAGTQLRYGILLAADTPAWLLSILETSLGIQPEELVFFDPATEQVALRHALVPTLLLQDAGFHPFANRLIEDCLRILNLPAAERPRRLFAVRRGYTNPAAPTRLCLNEERLVAIAAARHGFVPVAMEALSWPEQVGHFRDADSIIGLSGSALHTALFSRPGSRLASLGVMNFTQSDIGGLRRQYNGYMGDGVPVEGHFTVDEARFTAFLDAFCAWPGRPPPPGEPPWAAPVR